MKQGWRDKVLRYYKEFKSLSWRDRYKYDHDSKDIFGHVLYTIYEGIAERCAGLTEIDGMCSYCWDYYHNMVEILNEDDDDELKYYGGLKKKHLDYMMKLTKEGVDNGNDKA